MHQDAAEIEAIDNEKNQASKLLAKKLRPIYQLALLNVIQDKSVEESLKRLEKVCETLEERSFSEQIARIWWIVGALIESVSRQQLELGVSIKNLFGKVDALFRVILIIGERGLLQRQPVELIKNFLFYIAQPECDGPKSQAIKTAYRLEQFLPSEATRNQVLDNIAGPNQALLKTVAEAMKADIESVKSTLEVYVNGDLGKVELLKDLPQEMHIISDTLAMIGLGSQRQLIESQIETVKAFITSDPAASEEALLSMAAELIQVEQALDQMQKRQPVHTEEPRSETDVSRDYELDNVLTAVVTAALDDIQKTKTAILDFIKDSSHSENIDLSITLMQESRGALELLNQPRAVAIVDGLLAYLNDYDIVQFMEASRLDALSQVVASLEYYLEALGEHRGDADSILDFADVQLQQLLANVQPKPDLEDSQELLIIDDEPEAAVEADSSDFDVAALQDESEQSIEESAVAESADSPAEDSDAIESAELSVEIESEEVETLSFAPIGEDTDLEVSVDSAADLTDPPSEEIAGDNDVLLDDLSDDEIQAADLDVEEVESLPEPLVTDIGDAILAPSTPADDEESAPEPIVAAEISVEEPPVEVVDTAIAEDDSDEIDETMLIERPDESDQSSGSVDASGHESNTTEVEAVVVPEAEKIKVTPVDEELEVLKSGSDPDILEIYLEEAEEESQNIARLQQDWLLHPEDENALKNIRRAFHTIKGSGRLVGAMKIGEFAWDYEQLLNRVLDKTIGPNPEIINAVGKAAEALPQLVEELKSQKPPEANIAYLRGLARALAEFKAEQVLIEHTRQMQAIEAPYDRITDENLTDWNLGVGATTQVIPDDKKKQALLDQIEPDTMRVDPTAFDDPKPQSEAPSELQGNTAPAVETPSSSDAVDESIFDDTILSAPPPIPGTQTRADKSEERSKAEDHQVPEAEAPAVEYQQAELPDGRSESEYTQAIDYADTPAGQAELANQEADGLRLDDDPATESRPSIEVEIVEEDFDTRLSEDDLDPEILLEAEVPSSSDEIDNSPVDSLIEIQDEAETFEEVVLEAPEAEASQDALIAEADELEVEELEVEAPDSGGNEEALIAEAAELEVEELNVEAPESVDDDSLIPQALEVEIEEMQVEAPVSQEPPVDAVSADENSASSEVETGEGVTPDPFVDMTRSQMPGEGVGESEPPAQVEERPTSLSFDPDLLIIYQQEVEQHLNTVNSVLDHAEQVQELVPNENIYRALHTIHGASRTADISSIGELAGLLEKPLKSALSQNMALDHEIIALYRQGQRAIKDMTAELVATRQLPEIPQDLEVSLRALAEDFEEHTVEIPEDDEEPVGDFVDTLTMMNELQDSDQDNELLAIFIDEANELLEMSDNTLYEWSNQQTDESEGYDFSAVMELQRYLHTLKGGARMAELKEISDLSHEMESMFIAVIDGRVEKNTDLIELLRDCFDLLHKQVVEAEAGHAMSDSSQQVEILKNLRRGGAEEVVLETVDEGVDVDSEDIDIVSENLTGESLAGVERPSQDVIKVRSDLLDNLVNSAGEVSIYRARMEQQVAGLGSYLGELGQTISRLKGQLRNLEAETDAQIHFSHRAEESEADDFDPLEMDRYTMIQELSRSLGESVNDLSSLQNMLGEQVKDSETLLLQQSRVSTDLQDGLIKSRMVKFSGLLSRLRRLVRQSSQELGKKAELVIAGEENEVDNKVLDRMVAPLEHIIRNALSHGIETPVERVKKGKSETGKIVIDIVRDGSDIVIRVSDDGAGVNIEKVRSRAIQLGLLEKSQQVNDADLVQYILEPGFSTAEHVTQLSGRGVGMDVVDIEVKQLGGTLQIETTPMGTSFVARLPFTLSINQAILVRTGDEMYAIPLINIEGITRLDNERMVDLYRQDSPELEYAGQSFALHQLAKLVGSGNQFRPSTENDKQAVILSRAGDIRAALHVDEIIGNREIVVKTLGKQLSQVKGLSGASILADGSVVLILDVNGLMRNTAVSSVRVVYQAEEAPSAKMRNTVMVVDDSITMRRVASKLLERNDYEVVTAKDGVDALAQLQDAQPDVMLLDIEMPRMDGFELATHMQNEESFSKIPIIMITSRTGEKHRDRAFEIGVTNYMGKPYQEEELIDNIKSALDGR
ncbi:MAG: Hpt domain-containing protein [Pseudomonadota bacterium]